MKLICYLSNGYPTIEKSIEMSRIYTEAGCDVIEVDFPSRNPYLEGEFIAGRMKSALENCSDYSKYMEGIARIKDENPGTPLLVLAYDNTVEEIGEEAFVRFCLENGLTDMIYVGDNMGLQKRLIDSGLKISCYVQFHMPENEVEAARNSNGFVYLQAKPMTNNIDPNYPTLKDCISHLKSIGIEREIYVGVGIRDEEDIRMARGSGADGVFVGSTILKLHDNTALLTDTIRKLKSAT
ncbi:tryptophan synthase subunit alpha [Youngiibacter fragilis]|uniref:tryptophan synthase n=1 Tax=Youngiibacter fragilis 232.1 TaxID=994573 RepID=V7I3E9_9CLOT|nr:tryptophan synthase subunit alpha [Youngiibacter fragilis]ETA79522.1 tryptophan synthase subunit alpha [Youngiibacter fragilis 232.1]